MLEHLRALHRCGARAVRVRRAEDLDGIDGLIIPGGESTTIGKLLVRFEMLEPLRKRIEDGLPTFGTCAGMILLSSELDLYMFYEGEKWVKLKFTARDQPIEYVLEEG